MCYIYICKASPKLKYKDTKSDRLPITNIYVMNSKSLTIT